MRTKKNAVAINAIDETVLTQCQPICRAINCNNRLDRMPVPPHMMIARRHWMLALHSLLSG
jgi:hypothetical protein